jgi:predicted DCC family thiol-disulfide oxidoreductase YuxK
LKFLINNDKKKKILFSPLQGQIAKQMLNEDYQKNLNTFVIINNNKIHTKAKAIKFLIRNVEGFKKFSFLLLIPSPIIDLFYVLVGQIRYKFFGKTKNCLYLDNRFKNKFLV